MNLFVSKTIKQAIDGIKRMGLDPKQWKPIAFEQQLSGLKAGAIIIDDSLREGYPLTGKRREWLEKVLLQRINR